MVFNDVEYTFRPQVTVLMGGTPAQYGDATGGILSISKSSFWTGVREGRFPKPISLGPRTTVWRVQDIRALIEGEVAQ